MNTEAAIGVSRVDEPEPGRRPWYRRSPWPDVGILVAITILVMVVAWTHLDAPLGSDPIYYLRGAQYWPELDPTHHQLRVGLIWPLMLLVQIVGPGQFAMHVYATAIAWLFVIGGWCGLRPIVGRWAATIASVALVLHPFMIRSEYYRMAGQIMPDHPAAGLFGLAIGAVVVAARRGPGKRTTTLLVTAGVLIGGAYLVREYVVVGIAVVPLLLWIYRRPPIRWSVPVAIPAVLIFLAETLMNGVLYGRPLQRLSQGASHGRVRTEDPIGRLDAATKLVQSFFQGSTGWAGIALLAGLVAVVVLAWRGSRAGKALAAWVAAFVIPITLLAGVVYPVRPLLPAQNVRYWAVILPALLGALGLVIVRAVRARRESGRAGLKVAGGAAAVVLVSTSVGGLVLHQTFPASNEDFVHLRTFLRANNDTVINLHADTWAATTLDEVYRQDAVGGRVVWDGEVIVRDRTQIPDLEAIAADGGGHVLVSHWRQHGFPDIEPVGGQLVFRSEQGLLRVFEIPPADGEDEGA